MRKKILGVFRFFASGNAHSFNTSPGEKYGLDNLTIHHAALHEVLLSKIDLKCIHTGKRLTDIKQEEDSIVLYFEHGSMHTASYLVAADGIRSAVRQKNIACCRSPVGRLYLLESGH